MLSWKSVLLVVVIAVLALLVMDFNSRMADLRRLTAQREDVRFVATQIAATKTALEAQIAYATSEAAVANWAYEEGHMVRPGDQPIIPIASGEATAIPTPSPTAQPTKISNWQGWLNLILGP